MAQRRAIISRNWFWKKKFQRNLAKDFSTEPLLLFITTYEAIMSTNKSIEILACRRQVLSRKQREGERQRARVNRRVGQAKTMAKESALEVEEEEEDKIHGWFVYWIFGWEMRRLSKLEIRFRITSFSFFTLLDVGRKVPQAILALLDSFQELHLEW